MPSTLLIPKAPDKLMVNELAAVVAEDARSVRGAAAALPAQMVR